MSERSRISNWHRAIAENVPSEIESLLAEVAEFDRQKADRLALIQDYQEMLVIAHRRVASPGVLQPQLITPEPRFLSGSECAA